MPKIKTHVRMTHPDGREWNCPIAHVERARDKGYRLVDGEEVPPQPEGPFNPSDHNVEDVQAYLASATSEEADRVLAAEKAGKNRSTITGD